MILLIELNEMVTVVIMMIKAVDVDPAHGMEVNGWRRSGFVPVSGILPFLLTYSRGKLVQIYYGFKKIRPMCFFEFDAVSFDAASRGR